MPAAAMAFYVYNTSFNFQYSIRDANNVLGIAVGVTPPFNTPLEMLILTSAPGGVGGWYPFQYSIRDAAGANCGRLRDIRHFQYSIRDAL